MFGKDDILEKEQIKYKNAASAYISSQEKIQALLNKAIRIADEKKGSLGVTWERLQLFFELIRAYSKGEYKNVSTSTILTVIGAILYFVSPVDLVPDFLIGLGIMDDAAVIGYTLKKLSKEIDEYKNWKKSSLIAQ